MRKEYKWLIGVSAVIALAWVAVKIAGPADWLSGTKVYEGGDANMKSPTRTPDFEVNHDWGLEVELNGTFEEVTLNGALPPNEYHPSDLLPLFNQPTRLERTMSTGGDYYLSFLGKGTWRVVVHPVGKLK